MQIGEVHLKYPDEIQSLFGHAFDEDSTLVLTFARDGAVTWASDALLNVLGHSRAEFDQAKVDWDNVTPPEYWMVDEHRLGQLTRGNFADPSVIEFLHANGSRVAFRVQAARSLHDRSLVIALLTQLVERSDARAK
jgi:PAS domain-containing protein